jgi:hypothetical protein
MLGWSLFSRHKTTESLVTHHMKGRTHDQSAHPSYTIYHNFSSTEKDIGVTKIVQHT